MLAQKVRLSSTRAHDRMNILVSTHFLLYSNLFSGIRSRSTRDCEKIIFPHIAQPPVFFQYWQLLLSRSFSVRSTAFFRFSVQSGPIPLVRMLLAHTGGLKNRNARRGEKRFFSFFIVSHFNLLCCASSWDTMCVSLFHIHDRG